MMQGSKNLFSNTRQGGSKRKVLVAKVAEISVAKSTNAEECTTVVFLK